MIIHLAGLIQWNLKVWILNLDIDNNHIDLPELSSIRLGSYSLFGKWGYKWCSLSMKSIAYYEWMNESNIIDLPKLRSITSEGYSLWSPQIVEMESMKIEIG